MPDMFRLRSAVVVAPLFVPIFRDLRVTCNHQLAIYIDLLD